MGGNKRYVGSTNGDRLIGDHKEFRSLHARNGIYHGHHRGLLRPLDDLAKRYTPNLDVWRSRHTAIEWQQCSAAGGWL